MPIAFEELDGSPIESVSDNGVEVLRKFKCAWGDRLTLARELIGSVTSDGEGGYITTAPATYGPLSAATVDRVTIEPFGSVQAMPGDAQQSSYAHAVLTVRYGNTRFRYVGDAGTLASEELEPVAEFVTLPSQQLKWGASGPPLRPDEAPGRLLRGLDWVYTRHRVPELNAAIFDLVGKVNEATVTSNTLGFTFAAETLLYNPPTLRRTITSNGADAWQVTYRFTYRPTGWNRFWRPDTDTYVQLYNNAGAINVYEPGDFLQLM